MTTATTHPEDSKNDIPVVSTDVDNSTDAATQIPDGELTGEISHDSQPGEVNSNPTIVEFQEPEIEIEKSTELQNKSIVTPHHTHADDVSSVADSGRKTKQATGSSTKKQTEAKNKTNRKVASIGFSNEEWEYIQKIFEARNKHRNSQGKPLSDNMHQMLRQAINFAMNFEEGWFFSRPEDLPPVYIN